MRQKIPLVTNPAISLHHVASRDRHGRATWWDRQFARKSPKRRVRRAAILVAVVVVLMVIMLLVGTITKRMVRFQRRSEVFERNVQSMLLAEAGVQRAISQLIADPTYRGEHWTVPKEAIARQWPAEVVIRVEPVPEKLGSLRIIVDSHYPPDPQLRLTHHRERIVSENHKGGTQ